MGENLTLTVASRIRAERVRRDWSIENLASRSGVSRAMISKIERAESSPTAVVLGRLSGAFDLTISDLLAPAQSEGRFLARAAEQQIWRDPSTGYLRRAISPQLNSLLQMVQIELPPKVRIGFPASSYSFLHHQILVQSGTLHFVEGKVTHILNRGDCLQLGQPADCTYFNPGEKPCKYLVAVVRTK